MTAVLLTAAAVIAVAAAGSGILRLWWRREDKRNWVDEWFLQPALERTLTDVEAAGPTVALVGAWGAGVASEAPSPATETPRPHPHHHPTPALLPAPTPGLDYEDTGTGWAAIREEVLR